VVLRAKPQLILLDTQAYVHLGLNFENPKLLQLVELITAGAVELYITEVIRREVEADLNERADGLWKQCKGLAHDIERKGAAKRLKTLQAALTAITEERIRETVLRGFKDFQSRAKVKEIPIPADLVPALLNDYFGTTPPFGTGEKRKEFPDAISIYAAAAFADKKGQVVAVISDDSDIKKACARFPSLRSVAAVEDVMAEIISTRTRLKSTVENVYSFLAKPPGNLLVDIEESFRGLGFYWVGDSRGDIIEVDDVGVRSLRDATVVGVDADQAFAGVRADIKFTAEVSVESSFEWAEDYPRQRGSKRDNILNREVEVDVDLQISVDREGRVQHWKIVQVNNGSDVPIS
jgi:hypothetical protein